MANNYLLKQGVGLGALGNLTYDDETQSWALHLGYTILYALFATKYPKCFSVDKALDELQSNLEERHLLKPWALQSWAMGTGRLDIIHQQLLGFFDQLRSNSSAMGISNSDRALIYIGSLSGAFAHMHVFSNYGNLADQKLFVNTTQTIFERINNLSSALSLKHEEIRRILQSEPTNNLRWPGIRNLMKEISRPLNILSVSSSPRDQERLDLAKELNELEDALNQVNLKYSFKLHQVRHCRHQDLSINLDRHNPDILLFSGHGDQNTIIFEDDKRRSDAVDKFALARLLAGQERLKLVILNCCFSLDGAQYLANAVGQVIVMQGSVNDREAINFTREFFTALGNGRTFYKGFERAYQAIRLRRSSTIKPYFKQRNWAPNGFGFNFANGYGITGFGF